LKSLEQETLALEAQQQQQEQQLGLGSDQDPRAQLQKLHEMEGWYSVVNDTIACIAGMEIQSFGSESATIAISGNPGKMSASR
jgi:hypothetical protein